LWLALKSEKVTCFYDLIRGDLYKHECVCDDGHALRDDFSETLHGDDEIFHDDGSLHDGGDLCIDVSPFQLFQSSLLIRHVHGHAHNYDACSRASGAPYTSQD